MIVRTVLSADWNTEPSRSVVQPVFLSDEGDYYVAAKTDGQLQHEANAAIRSFDQRARTARRRLLFTIAGWLLLAAASVLVSWEYLR